jgi:hypothetical protein
LEVLSHLGFPQRWVD